MSSEVIPPRHPLHRVFFGPRRLRAGWRLGILALLVTVLQVIVRSVVTASHVDFPEGFSAPGLAASEAISFVFILLVTLVMGRIERRPLAAYGFPLRGALGRAPWVGFAWGFVAVALIVIPIALLGGVHYSGLRYTGSALFGMTGLWLLAMFLIGLAEELAFRGYLLRTLTDGMGFWPASVVLSIGFGALHYYTKPYETWVDFASVSLIALFLCWTLRRTGNLWWPIGFHAGFDFAQLSFFAGPNSGNDGVPVADALLVPHWHGADWLTGGKLGLEASAFVFPAIALCFLAFGRMYRGAKFPPAGD